MSNDNFKFKVGDIVRWLGNELGAKRENYPQRKVFVTTLEHPVWSEIDVENSVGIIKKSYHYSCMFETNVKNPGHSNYCEPTEENNVYEWYCSKTSSTFLVSEFELEKAKQ